jgi:hypothetical protein
MTDHAIFHVAGILPVSKATALELLSDLHRSPPLRSKYLAFVLRADQIESGTAAPADDLEACFQFYGWYCMQGLPVLLPLPLFKSHPLRTVEIKFSMRTAFERIAGGWEILR